MFGVISAEDVFMEVAGVMKPHLSMSKRVQKERLKRIASQNRYRFEKRLATLASDPKPRNPKVLEKH